MHPFVRGDVLDERFRISEEQARGSMGIVYRGHDLVHRCEVAVKVLLPEYCRRREYLDRFAREAEILSALSHPNLVEVLAVGRRGALPWLIMPFLEGSTLESVLSRGGPLATERVLDILTQTAAGLSFVHEHALAHRDVKPANIFVCRTGAVALLDFGLVRDLSVRSDTQPGLRIGTPAYMAPEQIAGHKADHRADIYAFGVLVYELLVGEPPFGAGTPHEVLRAHRFDVPPRPSQKAPHLSAAVDEVVLRALAKSPRDRFQSVDELLRRVRAALGADLTVKTGPFDADDDTFTGV